MTEVDRLSRSYKEVKELIVVADIPVHVVTLGRKIGRQSLLAAARIAEDEGVKIGRDIKSSLARTGARKAGSHASKKSLLKATAGSLRQRSVDAWMTVLNIVDFISADPIRIDWKRPQLVAGLNAASVKTTRGNVWTVGALTRPLRKAREHIKLQAEDDDGPTGFDAVVVS